MKREIFVSHGKMFSLAIRSAEAKIAVKALMTNTSYNLYQAEAFHQLLSFVSSSPRLKSAVKMSSRDRPYNSCITVLAQSQQRTDGSMPNTVVFAWNPVCLLTTHSALQAAKVKNDRDLRSAHSAKAQRRLGRFGTGPGYLSRLNRRCDLREHEKGDSNVNEMIVMPVQEDRLIGRFDWLQLLADIAFAEAKMAVKFSQNALNQNLLPHSAESS